MSNGDENFIIIYKIIYFQKKRRIQKIDRGLAWISLWWVPPLTDLSQAYLDFFCWLLTQTFLSSPSRQSLFQRNYEEMLTGKKCKKLCTNVDISKKEEKDPDCVKILYFILFLPSISNVEKKGHFKIIFVHLS